MGRKITKRDIDGELLDTIILVERDWKQIQSIVEKSIEPNMTATNMEAIAKAKYLFLLREARRRKVNAIRV
ncbi:YaaL family protein [Oceanobacillus saliphilus]|uniref:YaaL family protein n=1 Tax=Oceanobacillus saliphilus TaxID=2925834 RepID=UPI00201D333D|nr:YaaL family protein [Oceanobacillus saliphilus]